MSIITPISQGMREREKEWEGETNYFQHAVVAKKPEFITPTFSSIDAFHQTATREWQVADFSNRRVIVF